MTHLQAEFIVFFDNETSVTQNPAEAAQFDEITELVVSTLFDILYFGAPVNSSLSVSEMIQDIINGKGDDLRLFSLPLPLHVYE